MGSSYLGSNTQTSLGRASAIAQPPPLVLWSRLCVECIIMQCIITTVPFCSTTAHITGSLTPQPIKKRPCSAVIVSLSNQPSTTLISHTPSLSLSRSLSLSFSPSVRGSATAVFDWQGCGRMPIPADLWGVEPRCLAGKGNLSFTHLSIISIPFKVLGPEKLSNHIAGLASRRWFVANQECTVI